MKKKKKRLLKPIILGFAALYLTTMFLATYLMKLKFAEDYENTLIKTLSNLQKDIQKHEAESSSTLDEAAKRTWYQSAVNSCLEPGEAHMKLSAAVYDEAGRLLAKSTNVIGRTAALLEDLLPREDIETLARCMAENYQQDEKQVPPRYKICARESDQIYEILIHEQTWEKEQDLNGEAASNTFYESASSTEILGNSSHLPVESLVIWSMVNSRQIWSRTVAEAETSHSPSIQSASTSFPYVNLSYEDWKAWNESSYLRDFPESIDLTEWENNVSSLIYASRYHKDRLTARLSSREIPGCFLELRMESSPWLASMDYLKYIYLPCFAIMLACMLKIIYSANKLYDQQEALEETRKDFINAMAHELKTPLGIIRNFAENLQERRREEKRDYYLEQIVGQTEEMDRLVEEMLLVSKMESEKFTLHTESLSMLELIQEQLSRLEPLAAEKGILTEIREGQDFVIKGDRNYLSIGIWNLLSNAVVYNVPQGNIRILMEAESCSIENTGFPLTEEQLLRAFDLFYSTDKSRSSASEKHLGMGLYLAEKIFKKHGLNLSLENTDTGVRATVSSKR